MTRSSLRPVLATLLLTGTGLLLWWLITAQPPPPSLGGGGSRTQRASGGLAPAARKLYTMPEGRSRPLTLTVAGATISGNEWRADVEISRTKTYGAPGVPNGPERDNVDFADILYDASGRPVAQRWGSERWETRGHSAAELTPYVEDALNRSGPREGRPYRVLSLQPHYLIPGLDGDLRRQRTPADKHKSHAGDRDEAGREASILSTFYRLKVHLSGPPHTLLLNIRSLVQRENPGFAYDSSLPEYRDERKGIYPSSPHLVAGSNTHGATVKYDMSFYTGNEPPPAEFQFKVGTQFAGGTYLITEPWAGTSPWKDDELDPISGDMLLSEMPVPPWLDPEWSNGNVPPNRYQPGEYWLPRVRQQREVKIARLAAEAAAAGQ